MFNALETDLHFIQYVTLLQSVREVVFVKFYKAFFSVKLYKPPGGVNRTIFEKDLESGTI